jgi:hypothetical protein
MTKSVSVPTPALDIVARSRSLEDGLTKLLKQGRLGEAQKELAAVAAAADAVRGVSRAALYERKASEAIDPANRRDYLELARLEREKAGQA